MDCEANSSNAPKWQSLRRRTRALNPQKEFSHVAKLLTAKLAGPACVVAGVSRFGKKIKIVEAKSNFTKLPEHTTQQPELFAHKYY
jgi:hypothetical protein